MKEYNQALLAASQDFKDIANGSYTVTMLRKDIIDTWNVKESIDG